jgi:hypothetical protein
MYDFTKTPEFKERFARMLATAFLRFEQRKRDGRYTDAAWRAFRDVCTAHNSNPERMYEWCLSQDMTIPTRDVDEESGTISLYDELK